MQFQSARQNTIWVVDDSPLDAERTRGALGPAYVVETFRDGSAALERLGEGTYPDVIVVDWEMPGVSGPEVCQFLRSSKTPALAEIGILLLTSHRTTEYIVLGLSAGANDYVVKPFQDAELLARVSALVRARELRERAEAAEALNRRLLATAPDALFGLDAAGRIAWANEEACRVLGHGLEGCIGLSPSQLLPDAGLEMLTATTREGLLPDVTIRDRIFAPTARSFDGDGIKSSTISLRDVSEQRESERRRLDFYSIIAHDLRSPLMAIMLRTDLMLRGKHGILPASLIAEIRKIEGNLKSLTAMINDFLELGRIQSTTYKIEREAVDLSLLIASIMDDFDPLLKSNKITWVNVTPDEPVVVPADRRRIVQVITNLVGNAIKFTPPEGRITTRITSSDDHVQVSIEDTGRGMAPEALKTIFNRYTRAIDPQHEVAGTGLGLMIVRDVVQAHGGAVGVESTTGKGSTFWFRIPRAEVNP